MVLSNAQWFANPGAEAHEIDYSCRFDSDTPAYLSKTFGTPTSDKLWTFSFWAKVCKIDSGNYSIFIGAGDWNGNYTALSLAGAIPDIKWEDYQSSAWKTQLRSDAKYADPAAWYHIVYSYDSTPSTPSSSSIKIFVNGSQVTSFSSDDYPSQNQASIINTAVANWIGGIPTNGANYYFDGYMAEVVFVDGTALDADSFGETNSTTGQWIPKAISGLTFGNNGFHLDFADSSALGNDVSGNNNDFASSGLAADDQVVDTPTDNYCTLNPVRPYTSGLTFSEGNLRAITSGAFVTYQATFQIPATGKWYCEIVARGGDAPISGSAAWDGSIGIGTKDADDSPNGESTNWTWGNAYVLVDGTKYNGSGTTLIPASSLTDGSVVMMAIDMDNSKLWWGVDGSWMGTASGDNDGNPATGANPAYDNLSGDLFPMGNCQLDPQYWNFGQLGFAHTPPDGFAGLYWSQLDDPTIEDPSAYFQTTLYTGDGASSLAVNQDGNSTFEPDFVWIKNRDATDVHVLFDTVRGATIYVSSNNSDAEVTDADTLTAFDSDGFTVGDDVKVNTSGEDYVGWQWLADESWSSGATGTRIASSGIRNTTMGFSIASWTHTTSANYNIAHGLSTRPDFFLTRNRDAGTNWDCWHQDQGQVASRIILNTSGAEAAAYWSDPTDNSNISSGEYPVTSTLFGFQSGALYDGNEVIAYFFTEIEGFSKFGSYTGNGSADGPFIWCGFRPAWLMIKRTDGTGEWYMMDDQRDSYNNMDHYLRADTTNAEGVDATSISVNFLSNGFKMRYGSSGTNGSGQTFVSMAFAKTPFKTATAR